MKRHLIGLFTLALSIFGPPSHAELKLDPGMKPKQVEATVKPLFQAVVRPYGDQHSADFGGSHGKMGTFDHDDDKFAWLFNGRKLFSMVGSFTPEIVPLEDCLPDLDCDHSRKRFKVCHLFLFNGTDLKLESVTRLNIVRDKGVLQGLPRCRTVQAMAVAKTVPDAMLITLGYIDSAEPAEKSYDPPEFYTTLLLRFKDDNGKLKIEQDDRCLGNPNNYDTIAAARTALGKCAGAKP